MPNDQDPQNPIDAMMPEVDNPEYHRRKAEHKAARQAEGENAVLADPAFAGMQDRISRGGVRANPPQAASPQPGQGITVDPTLQPEYQPVEPRLPEAAQPPAPQAPAPGVGPIATPVLDASTSPLLSKLRQDFGIDQLPLKEIKVNGHVFSMRVLDAGLIATAVRFADSLSMVPRENEINFHIALVSFSVMAIDNEPLYSVFDVDIPNEEQIEVEGVKRVRFAPMNPPMSVRNLAATQFMAFLNKDVTPELVDALYKAYGSEVDPQGTLTSLMEAGEPEEDVPLS